MNIPNLDDLEQKIVANQYPYYNMIKTPQELNINANPDNYDNNIEQLMNYLKLLMDGGGKASKVNGILGNKYFLSTGANCTDIITNNQVTRSIYINNIPDDDITNIFGSSMNGLIPQTINSINNIKPLAAFNSLVEGDNSACQLIEMATIDIDNKVGTESHYVSVLDIKGMNPCLFNNQTNPVTNEVCGGTELFPPDFIDIMINKVINNPNNKNLDPIGVRDFFTTEVSTMSPCLFKEGINPVSNAICPEQQGFQNYYPYNNNYNNGFHEDVASTIKYLYFISLAILAYYILKKHLK